MSTDVSALLTAPAAPPSATEQAEPWAMGHLPSHVRLWIATIVGLVADLWTKSWAFQRYDADDRVELIRNLCSLRLSLNPGALFGIGAGLAPIFVGASVLALMFVLYLFANSGAKRWSMHFALGCVLAGALGNLYDRTTQSAYVAYLPDRGRIVGTLISETSNAITLGDFPTGANPRTYPKPPADGKSGLQPVVRDFIQIEAKIGNVALWPWIFNIADALLVVGVGVLLIHFWRDHKDAQAAPQA